MSGSRPARTESPWGYVGAGLLLFTALGLDFLSLFVGKALDGRALSDPAVWSTHWYATVGTFLSSTALWAITVALFAGWARRRSALPALFSLGRDRRVFVACGLGVVALAALSLIGSSGPGGASLSVVREYHGFVRRYDGHGGIVTAFQYLYYLLESAVVLAMIAVFQRAGELWWRRAWVPWGGLGLMLTWGLVHFLSHPEGAAFVVVTALVFGLVFVAARKSVVPLLVTLWLAFVL